MPLKEISKEAPKRNMAKFKTQRAEPRPSMFHAQPHKRVERGGHKNCGEGRQKVERGLVQKITIYALRKNRNSRVETRRKVRTKLMYG
jgi:hypothetical protein